MMPLRARDIADLCDDLAIERASVTTKEGWDHNSYQFFLTFGPLSARQTMVIEPKMTLEEVKDKLESAMFLVMPRELPPKHIQEKRTEIKRQYVAEVFPQGAKIAPAQQEKPAPVKGKRKKQA